MTEITLKEEELQAMIVLKLIQAHARAEAKKRTGKKMDPTGAALCTMRMGIEKIEDGHGIRTYKFSFSPKIVT